MNVLFVLARYPGYAGIEKVSTILCNSLCEIISWVGIYSFDQQGETELLPELNPNVCYIKAEDKGKYHSKRNTKQINSLVKSNEIDIVVYQDSYAPYLKSVVSALKGLQTKLVVVEHNTPEQSLRTYPIKEVIRKNIKNNKVWSVLAYYKGRFYTHFNYIYKYIRCDKYVLLSKNYEPTFRKLVPFASDKKLTAINNPCNTLIQNIASEKKKICLFCARLEPQKGIEYLMDIWTRVENIRKDWQLVIVGNGSKYQYIKDAIRQRKLTNVRLDGYQQNTALYYSSAQIFLMTSLYEGWGMTVVEAKSQSCIPIAFNSFAAASEVINNGVDGYLIPAFYVDAYANTLISLMDDEQRKSILSQNAIDDIRRFSVENISSQWIALFNSLIDCKKT